MTDKNREIEEMAKVIEETERKKMDSHCDLPSVEEYATDLYNAGYRKQSEGEWKQAYNNYPRYVCTNCNHLFNNKAFKYCPNCGARMTKGR